MPKRGAFLATPAYESKIYKRTPRPPINCLDLILVTLSSEVYRANTSMEQVKATVCSSSEKDSKVNEGDHVFHKGATLIKELTHLEAVTLRLTRRVHRHFPGTQEPQYEVSIGESHPSNAARRVGCSRFFPRTKDWN